jgi:hypothetical protein
MTVTVPVENQLFVWGCSRKIHPQFSLTLARVGDSHTHFKMTIGELRDELEDWPEGDEIIFGCEELEFYRFKKRGADTVQLEFNRPFTRMQRQASGMSMIRLCNSSDFPTASRPVT